MQYLINRVYKHEGEKPTYLSLALKADDYGKIDIDELCSLFRCIEHVDPNVVFCIRKQNDPIDIYNSLEVIENFGNTKAINCDNIQVDSEFCGVVTAGQTVTKEENTDNEV